LEKRIWKGHNRIRQHALIVPADHFSRGHGYPPVGSEYCTMVQAGNPQRIVSPKRGFAAGEESAAALPATSRFLADKPGFGTTRSGVGRFCRKRHH